MSRFSFIILLIIACAQAAAQSFTTYNYSVAEGLPSAEVYQVFQDSKGFLWFATDNGVCRYDGKDMEAFHVKDGLSDPVVFGFSEDHKGRIWFRTYSGKASYFENGRIHQYKFNDLLTKVSENVIPISLYCDSLDNIWFSAGNIICKIDSQGNFKTEITKHSAARIISVDKETSLASFSGPPHRIKQIFVGEKSYNIQLSDTTVGYHVMCFDNWNNKKYVSINNDIFEYDGQSFRNVYIGKAPVISLSRDKENTLWVGYLNKGAERFRANFSSTSLSMFEDRSITKVLQDHEGGFWFTSLEQGIYYVPNLSIENFKPQTLSKIKAIVSAPDAIITGDNSGKVVIFDPNDGKIIREKQFPDPIVCLYLNKKGALWVSTRMKLNVWDLDFKMKWEIYRCQLGLTDAINGKVWGISGATLSLFSEEGKLLNKNRNVPIYRSVLMSDSMLFLTGRTGLDIRNQDMEYAGSVEAMRNFKISQLLDLNDSTFVVATLGNGFFLLNKKNWQATRFDSEHNFYTDNIYSVLATDSLLWIGTEKGIAVTPISGLLAGNINFNFLNRRSGLIANKINFLTAGKNSIWAFTDDGISRISTTHVRYASKKPLFILNDILVNGKKITTSENLAFNSDQNNLLIQYTCISFNNQNVLSRYRLSPDKPWIYNNNRKILLSSMAPGQYLFELEYSTDNIKWATAVEPFAFMIVPSWWNRWYIQLFFISLLGLISYWYFRYQQSVFRQKHHYLKIINDHQQKLIQSEIVTLERERNRIARELHDRVGTNLTAIKLMVSQLLQNYKEPLAHDIEEQFQIAIKEIKDIIYGLTPPSLERYGLFTGLRNYIGKLNKTIPLNISLKTFGKEVHNYELNIMVFRVLQELLTNSIKHSFAKNITIHLSAFENVLNVVYEDDGVGFSYDPVQSGMGLNNIESRINSVKGTLKFESGKFGVSYTIDIPIHLNKEVV